MTTTFAWTIDDAGMGGERMIESVGRTASVLESRGLRATWFVVPRPGGEPLPEPWRAALLDARERGHDLQLHGLTHEDCYEFGPPNWPATDILPSLGPEFERRRAELSPRYTRERLRGRIAEGIERFETAFGARPSVFRAPCGAISRPMFEALADLGIRYHSCCYVSGTGYDHLPHRQRTVRHAWADTYPHRPFRWYAGVVEAPILNEWTWAGARRQQEAMFEAARADLDRIRVESPVAVLLSHTHGIADDYEHAFAVVDAVLEHLDRSGDRRFETLGELAASGELDRAATVDGPDLLAI